MAHPGFGHLWQQAEMSDLDIVISVDYEYVPNGTESRHALFWRQYHQQLHENDPPLQQFPGHSTILSLSPFFKAQALRWSTPSQPQGRTRSGKGKAVSKRQAKQLVTITLPDASHEPAAMAVLKGLYQVEPWPKLLADLTPQQQVQAAVLADMWQLTAASDAAVALLQKAANSGDSSQHASAALEQLLSMAAVPDSLMPVFGQSRQALLNKYLYEAAVPDSIRPLFEQALLSKYGDLEAVWEPGATSLQESLLALPLHAMELLLASDKLKVASEDTVMYTAQTYVGNRAKFSTIGSRQQAVDRLAPLVRCPRLSQFWLSASVLSDDADKLLLRGLQPQLKRLMLLQAGGSTAGASVEQGVVPGVPASWLEDIPGVPASWRLPVRRIQPVSSTSVQWDLDVADIRQAVQDSISKQQKVNLWSPKGCLLGGVLLGINLSCKWDASKQGSTINVYTHGKSLPAGSCFRCTCSVGCAAVAAGRASTGYLGHAQVWGWRDYFRLGPMSGGFDEAAWAAKGLPKSGSITLQLTVNDAGM